MFIFDKHRGLSFRTASSTTSMKPKSMSIESNTVDIVELYLLSRLLTVISGSRIENLCYGERILNIFHYIEINVLVQTLKSCALIKQDSTVTT